MEYAKSNYDLSEFSLKRISYLMIGIFFVGAILFCKLFQTSVIEYPKYKLVADSQRTVKKQVYAKRGEIFAQDNAEGELYKLATGDEKYSISVVPKNVKDKQLVAKDLAFNLSLDEKDIFDKINNNKLYVPPILHRADADLTSKIEELNLIGVLITPEDSRVYPENNLASHVLGFVNMEGEGKYGIEGYYNKELKGSNGIIEGEKDALGDLITLDSLNNLVNNGDDLVLTIDHNVQFVAEQKLAQAIEKYSADSGSIIVMNPKTGAILAMTGNKNFNPNKFNEVKKEDQGSFLNPTISDVWEPGSIIKPITMAMAINEGKIEPDTTGDFSNMIKIGKYEIHTAQDKAFGHETMTQCLENSDNVCLSWVADQLGNESMNNYLDLFGFSKKTGIDVSGETTGFIPNLKDWRDINRATISFGQGISTTPLQMLTAISAIANDGKLMKPYLVDKIINGNDQEIVTNASVVREAIKKETADKVKAMMVSVVELGHGKKAKVEGYSVAGKTGTAQVPDPNGGYYTDRHVGSFAGFFPADNPQFSMIVKLDNPKNVDWAEASAAPVFGEMASYLLGYYEIAPTQNQ
jgi:cell division protein FtsI/penicillin-binding protein 2